MNYSQKYLHREHRYDEARQAYESALQHRPALAAAHNGLGATLMALGDGPTAERELRAAADLDRGDPNPLLNLALLRTRAGDREGAEQARNEASARGPLMQVN